ncbi:MAG TPA: hypothetical protein VEL68_06650 [Thermodesulfobacteriota bacterium]|nr:hypothetical protein [Thermodesulfobacteriota bacterium]
MPWDPLAAKDQVLEMGKFPRERAGPESMNPGHAVKKDRECMFEYLQEEKDKVKKNSQIDD